MSTQEIFPRLLIFISICIVYFRNKSVFFRKGFPRIAIDVAVSILLATSISISVLPLLREEVWIIVVIWVLTFCIALVQLRRAKW